MAKPMEVTIVNAVPLFSAGADCATKVENCGESAVTVIPQIIKKNKNKNGGNWKLMKESRQQIPDAIKAQKATFLLPMYCESSPPRMQPALPLAMMMKDQSGTFILCRFM